MKIELDLTEKELNYLLAACVDLFHKMRAAEEEGPLVPNFGERMMVAKSLWKKIDEVVKVDEF
jgi:hypothetical protein